MVEWLSNHHITSFARNTNICSYQAKRRKDRTGEVAQKVGTLVGLSEDLGLGSQHLRGS